MLVVIEKSLPSCRQELVVKFQAQKRKVLPLILDEPLRVMPMLVIFAGLLTIVNLHWIAE